MNRLGNNSPIKPIVSPRSDKSISRDGYDPSDSGAPLTRSDRAAATGTSHAAVQSTSFWSCLYPHDESEDESTEMGSDVVEGGYYSSDADDVSRISDEEVTNNRSLAPAKTQAFNDASIAELKAAIESETKYWSSKYSPDKPNTPAGEKKHDPEFKKLIDGYVHELKLFYEDIEKGNLTEDKLLESSNLLGTLWLRAVGLADSNGWTDTTRLCMKDAGDAYAIPSVKANWYNMGAGLARSGALAAAGIGGAMLGCTPLSVLYASSAISFTYVGVQLGFSVMLPLENAAAQSGAVKRQAQWGPLFNSSLESSKCSLPAGGEHRLRTLAKVQAEFNEVAKLKSLYGQTECDPDAVRESRQKCEHRQTKFLHKIERQVESLQKRLKKAQEKGGNIGDAGKKVLAAADATAALAAAQGLKGTPYAPSAIWYARTSKARTQHDLYAFAVAQLDHALDGANLDRATSISDEGVPSISPKTLALLLSQAPPAINKRMAELTWELATTDRYETLNVLTNQGHSRAARNALNLLAALFSMIGNAEDLATVQQDAQELLAEIGKATAEVVQETGTSFIGELFGSTFGPILPMLSTLDEFLKMPMESKWEILSFLTLLAQPMIYTHTQGAATSRDMENKLATQAQIAALTNHGQILKDGKVNPAGLDAAMKGSMKVRMDHFKKTLEFDSKVYQNALWALLADRDHVTATNAQSVTIPKGDKGEVLTVSCTYMGLNAAFAACKTKDDRVDLITALGNARDLSTVQMQSLTEILRLYEQNLINIDHVGKNNLQALLGPGSTLPESSQLMLGSALRYAQAPKHLPASDPRHDEVEAYLQSKLGTQDAAQDDLLAEKFGRTERRNNTGNVNQSAQKMGQSYMWFIAGSGGPTTVKAIATSVSEGLKMAGGYVNPSLNMAALGVRMAGNVISMTGSLMGMFLGYSFHKFILQKNLDRARDVDLKVPSVANSSVLSIEDRDFMTLMSLDRMRGEVTNYETLLSEPIPASTLPAPLHEFKQFAMQLLPEFLGQAAAAPGTPTLPPLPTLRYESRTSFANDIWVQMRAAPLGEIFSYMSAPHGGLAQVSDEEVEAIVKEAAAAMFDEVKRREDEEGVSGDDDGDDEVSYHSDEVKINFADFAENNAIDVNQAILDAQEHGLWHDHPMEPRDRDGRVAELVELVRQQSAGQRDAAIETLQRVETNFERVVGGENRAGLDEGTVLAIQQSYDLVSQALRKLNPSAQPRIENDPVAALIAEGLWTAQHLTHDEVSRQGADYAARLRTQGYSATDAMDFVDQRIESLKNLPPTAEVEQVRQILLEAMSAI